MTVEELRDHFIGSTNDYIMFLEQKFTQPCPECEKNKVAVERLISHEDFCPFKQPCMNPDNDKVEVCKECVRKWAYKEDEK